VNETYDTAEAKVYTVTIVGKESSSRSGNYVEVSNWRDENGTVDIRVGLDQYRDAVIGDRATVKEWPGALGASWHILDLAEYPTP
jgi:hypothetical protein